MHCILLLFRMYLDGLFVTVLLLMRVFIKRKTAINTFSPNKKNFPSMY